MGQKFTHCPTFVPHVFCFNQISKQIKIVHAWIGIGTSAFNLSQKLILVNLKLVQP